MVVEVGGQNIAIQAALRRLGVNVRNTIDTVIATRSLESEYDLQHNDRDFDPLLRPRGPARRHLKNGLKNAPYRRKDFPRPMLYC
jgi:hypothetical protein